jgi:hypothetical protein
VGGEATVPLPGGTVIMGPLSVHAWLWACEDRDYGNYGGHCVGGGGGAACRGPLIMGGCL